MLDGPPRDLSSRTYALALAAALVVALALRLPGLTAPFGADGAGWSGAFFATIARNMLRLGTIDPVMNAHPSALEAVSYTHHPPLAEWIMALVFAVFGVGETAARVPFLIASVLAVPLVARVARREMGSRTAGVIAAFTLATCPVAVIYGHQPDVVCSLLVLAMLGTVSAYVGYRERGDARAATWLVCWTVAGVAVDWLAVFVIAALVAHAVLVRPRALDAALLTGGAGFATCVLVALWLTSIPNGGGWGALAERVSHRTYSFTTDTGVAFGLRDVAWGYLRHHGTMIGPALLALALVWGVRTIRHRVVPGPATFAFVAFLVVFMVVSVQSLNEQEFWLHATAPAYAIVAAAVLSTWRARPAAVLGIAALVALANVAVTAATRAHRVHSPTGPAVAALHATLAGWVAARVPEDDIVAVVDRTTWPTLHYYLDHRLLVINSVDALRAPPAHPMQSAQWVKIPAAAPPSWLLVRGDPAPSSAALVERRGEYALYRLE